MSAPPPPPTPSGKKGHHKWRDVTPHLGRSVGFLQPLFGEVDISPASKAVLLVPGALAVADEDHLVDLLLRHLVFFDSSNLCKLFGKGETYLGNIRKWWTFTRDEAILLGPVIKYCIWLLIASVHIHDGGCCCSSENRRRVVRARGCPRRVRPVVLSISTTT